MPVRRDPRTGNWFFRKLLRLPDGRRERIYGVPTMQGLPNTKVGAVEAERREINRVLADGVVNPKPPKKKKRKEVPTVREFSKVFLEASRLKNKPSSVESKESILRLHVLPSYGDHRLDKLDYGAIEDLKVELAQKLSHKSINNVLTVVRRMLAVARKRGLIDAVPEIEWLKVPPPPFDFLTFDEADRLVAASKGEVEWQTMILTGLRTGLRRGELLGLRWEDLDLVAGRLMVRQSIVRGRIVTPKSGRSREIPLGDQVLTALKMHRHLRGPLVFCKLNGRAFTRGDVKHPLNRATRRAGLRHIGWHVLRHTFASHLVMRGVPLKVVQELMGHATIEMTMRYAHLSPAISREAVRLLDSCGSGVAARTENIPKLLK